MRTVKHLARNNGFLFVNGIATNLLSFFAMLYIARCLEPEDYGIFSFAFIYFFSFIPDMGIHRILEREASRESEKAGKLIGNGTIIKFFLSFVALLLALILINVINFPLLPRKMPYT